MQRFLCFCGILCLIFCVFAQNDAQLTQQYEQMESVLSARDEAMLRACPVLKLDAIQQARPLPAAVDNSRLPFMTPIYSQSALECGQASSIAYTFSYEMNCLRGTNNNSTTRRYPTHFAWNFCNQGSSRGVSFMDTWEVVRTAGTPNVADWGGWYDTGGPSRWASGYNLYYKAMQNRIVEFLAIPTDSEEGLLTLKHWLDNHLRGDSHGGLANFYSTHVPNGHEMLHQIPVGTPHAGEWIVPALQSNVNHGQTIVGYNDSICWDFNGDGMYTNDRDLNGDGIVDIRDWEVGAVIFCNSFGTGFANAGYCYLPYRKLAELPANGGIWNKCVYVVNVKEQVNPRLTYKVTLQHTCRNKIKLQAGVSTNLSASVPDHTIDWAVFNFQGGELYMQGGETEADQTLELGLDVSRLLEFIQPGQQAKFFLQVIENDEDGTASGQVVNFSLMDYQGQLPVETACAQTFVPLVDNGTTTLSVTQSIDFDRPRMAPAPPAMEAFSDYSYQIPVSGGTAPYRFEFTKDYTIEEFSANFPAVAGTTLNFSNNDNGYVEVDLPFSFPYYDNEYQHLCIFTDGYMTFRYDTYNWPFLQSSEQQQKATQMIAPFCTDIVLQEVKMENNGDALTLHFRARVAYQQNSTLNYAVKLHPDGVIEMCYGSMDFTGNGGLSLISRGDTRIWQPTPVSEGTAAAMSNRNFRFTPPAKVDFLTLSRDGVLAGVSREAFANLPIPITCFDINDQRHDTLLYLSCEYGNMLTITDVSVEAGGDDIISAGEEVALSFTVRNLDTVAYNDCRVRFTTGCPYVEMIDDEEYFGYIGGGNAYTLNRAIRFRILPGTPNLTIVDFAAFITNESYPMTSMQSFTVHNHWLELASFAVDDGGNHLVDAGENDTLRVWFKNAGTAPIHDLQFELRFNEADITMLDTRDDLYLLNPGETKMVEFAFHPEDNFDGHGVLDALIDVTTGGQYSETKVITLITELNCENFENAIPSNFSMGNIAWSLTDEASVDGQYSMQSGDISHNDTTSMSCTFTAVRNGDVSFYFKTSTENNYDWLYFYIDGVQQNRWSGTHDWAYTAYPVQVGEHTLTWKYIKDYSVDGGSDCVWVDNLCFPLDNEAIPELQITPASVQVTAHAEEVVVPLHFESVTPIYLLFENEVMNDQNQSMGWAVMECAQGSLGALQSRDINLLIRMAGMPEGIYHARLVATVTDGNQVVVPIEITATETGVNEYVAENFTTKVYPNPTSGNVTVALEGINEGKMVNCRLFDMSGKQLECFQKAENQFVVSLENFVSGLYFLQMSVDGESPQVVKIVKR